MLLDDIMMEMKYAQDCATVVTYLSHEHKELWEQILKWLKAEQLGIPVAILEAFGEMPGDDKHSA